MPTSILSVAKTAADSADIAITGPTTISLKGTDANSLDGGFTGQFNLSIKDDAGIYNPVPGGVLHAGCRVLVIIGPGTYRLSRTVTSVAVGAFSG